MVEVFTRIGDSRERYKRIYVSTSTLSKDDILAHLLMRDFRYKGTPSGVLLRQNPPLLAGVIMPINVKFFINR
jgi:hypothetical protein